MAQLISNHQNYEIIHQHLLEKKTATYIPEKLQEKDNKRNIANVIDKMSWLELKSSLEMFGQEDVVTELQEKSLLTKGMWKFEKFIWCERPCQNNLLP